MVTQGQRRGLPLHHVVFLCLLVLGCLIPSLDAAFTCNKPHALTAAPGPNNLCQCADGWFGPTCEICTQDQVCGVLLKDPEGICRNSTFTAIRESFGWCEISSQDVGNLIHGTGYVQIYFAANGTFFFDFIKRRGAGDFISLFRCDSKKTKITEDPARGQVKYASPDLVCNMTCEIGADRTCSKGLGNIVKMVGSKGGSTIICDPKKRTCDVHENTLDTFLGGVQTTGCFMSECALKGETVSVSVGNFANIINQPPSQQTAYILGMMMLTMTLAIMAMATSYSLKSSKFQNYASTAHLLDPTAGAAAAGIKSLDNNDHSNGSAYSHNTSNSSGSKSTVGSGAGAEEVSPGGLALSGEEAGTSMAEAHAVAKRSLMKGHSSSSSSITGAADVGTTSTAALALGAAAAAAAAAATAASAGTAAVEGQEEEQKTYSVAWDGIKYHVGKRQILKGVSGYALPGELLAIMGPSGSGKTTMIDILAMKTKRGVLSGNLYYGGKCKGEDAMVDEEIRETIGFVDQEDNLMGTLTVFEAVLFSAFLRLPDSMPMEDKARRVLQVLKELRIQHVADSFIGIKGRRGISGGEKRRVVVAMELVKVPSILYLDEPTSGLDSFNAALLVDCLKDLAFKNKTNVIMTIHQPRSNVFTGFDRNLVLNQGEVTYFGHTKEVAAYFASIGHAIPSDYNPADFLIDVLFLECACEYHDDEGPEEAEEEMYGNDKNKQRKQKKITAGAGADDETKNEREVEMVPVVPSSSSTTIPPKRPATNKRQGSRATFQQRLGSPVRLVAPTTRQGTGENPVTLSPPRVVRVDMDTLAGAGHEDDDEEEQEQIVFNDEEEKEEKEVVEAGGGKDGEGRITEADPSHRRSNSSSTLTRPQCLPAVEAFFSSNSTVASAVEGAGGSSNPNPFALAFRQSERHKRMLNELDALIGATSNHKEVDVAGAAPSSSEGTSTSGGSRKSAAIAAATSAVSTTKTGGSPTVAAAASVPGEPPQQQQQQQPGEYHPRQHLKSIWKRMSLTTHRWCWEVGVLSRRSSLDLTRNPVLFLSHVGAATYFAVILGTVYYNLSMSNLQAVQNRLGAFLLSCVFLSFTSVSALPLFWLEKNLYLHEQSNRFYTSSAYFVCKVFFDLIPLRVIPTVIYGAITYGMIGLRPGFQHFVIYEAFLVLLVTTSAIINLIIGMWTKHIMSGILIATIVMIHFLMLTNLFINFDSMNIHWLRFLKRVSFLNYAYEGLAENELVGRRLEHFAISTGTGVLHELGFSTTAMYFDLMSLLIYLMVTLVIGFVVLKVCVREMR